MKTVYAEPPMEPLIGAGEAAEYLGFSSLTVRRMAHDGRLPSIAFPLGKDKLGNQKYLHRFRVSDLKAYLATLERRPVQQEDRESQSELALHTA